MRVMYTLINKLLPFTGLNMRSPIIISINGRGPKPLTLKGESLSITGFGLVFRGSGFEAARISKTLKPQTLNAKPQNPETPHRVGMLQSTDRVRAFQQE